MKNERLLSGMNLLDDKYIDEANPQNRKRKKINWLRFGALAACVCLMVTALNLFLFIPFKTTVPDVSQYENSEYFPIIEKINALSAVKPKYKNNFDKIISSLSAVGGAFDNNVDMDASNGFPTSPEGGANGDFDSGSADEEYNEITDNQVSGVTEGDIIKRSDKYIYYLASDFLRIYSIEGEDSKLISETELSPIKFINSYGKEEETNINIYNCEMYLSQDCKTINIIGMHWDKYTNVNKTVIVSFDVSDVNNKATLKNYVSVEGNYKTSRVVDGKLLVVTTKAYGNIDYSKPETFVPSISYDNGTKNELIPMEYIACPDKIINKNYTVVSLLDESTLNFDGCAGFLSFSNDIYVTNNAIYASNTSSVENSNKLESFTEIACISFSGGSFDIKGAIKIAGYINDRYNFDEYNGILRVVTTTETRVKKYYDFSGNETVSIMTSEGSSASLYCIDLATWEVVASVENFAPKGETVRSVRFDKDYAYVCTAVQLTDPVFFFDLSDLSNITYKETGNIEGFSTSLINLGDGYLLGIGRGDSWSNIKVEVYRENESKVESVCSYEIKNGSYSQNYKSYYINRDTGMFGFGYHDYDAYYGPGRNSYYVLLLFANGELLELVNTPINGQPEYMRSVYIDVYLYIFGTNDFKVIKI